MTRAKDMTGSTSPPLLGYIANGGSRRVEYLAQRAAGWVLIDDFRAAEVTGLKTASVKAELVQLGKRGSIEIGDPISGETTKVRLTQQGFEYVLAARLP